MHRLDVSTSGVMVVVCSERGCSVFKRALKNRKMSKTYHALVQGHPDPLPGTIGAPIDRHPSTSQHFAVHQDGRYATTHYEALEAFTPTALLKVNLETGHMHRIRMHFSALSHPCCGNPMYGPDPALAKQLGLDRRWLHTVSFGLHRPADGRWMEIECPYPDDSNHILEVLGQGT